MKIIESISKEDLLSYLQMRLIALEEEKKYLVTDDDIQRNYGRRDELEEIEMLIEKLRS